MIKCENVCTYEQKLVKLINLINMYLVILAVDCMKNSTLTRKSDIQ